MSQAAESVFQSRSKKFCFQFDEYCDLLGGAVWGDLIKRRFSSDRRSERGHPPPSIESRFSSQNQFLLTDRTSHLCPLEILWLKWNVFSDLCREVYAFHRDKKKSHLNISPRSVLINIPDPISESLPSRWIFSLKLDGRSKSRRFSLKGMPSGMLGRLYMPPTTDDNKYRAPVVRERPLGYEVSGIAAVRSVEKVQGAEERDGGDEKIRGITEFHFLSEDVQKTEFSEHDIFLVKLYFNDESFQPVEIWASNPVPLEKGILLKGSTRPMDARHWEKFEHAKERIFSHANMKIFKAYLAPCDLYSLGMMLLRLLLVNDEQDIETVNEVIQKLTGRLAPMVQGLGPEDRQILIKRFKELFHGTGSLFSKTSILYSPPQKEEIEPFIPDDLWIEVLIYAFRLITFIPGFSYCRSHGDAQFEQPHLLMETVIQDVAIFSERIKIPLFRSHRRDIEIREVCGMLRKELTEGETTNDAV